MTTVVRRALTTWLLASAVVGVAATGSWATGDCAGLANLLDAGDAPPRLFTATVAETTGASALVEVGEVWTGPDLAPDVWVAGLGNATVGDRWLVGSTTSEVATDGCWSALLEPNLDHRVSFTPRPPVTGGATGEVPLTSVLERARSFAIAGLVVLVGTAAVVVTRHRAARRSTSSRPEQGRSDSA